MRNRSSFPFVGLAIFGVRRGWTSQNRNIVKVVENLGPAGNPENK